jgi:glucose-6-phosphate-specific signal transduction histidine kinase
MSLLIFVFALLSGSTAGVFLGSAWQRQQHRRQQREVKELLERKRGTRP